MARPALYNTRCPLGLKFNYRDIIMARRLAYVSSRPLRSPRKAFKPSKRFMSGVKVSPKPAAKTRTSVPGRNSDKAFYARMKDAQNERLASTISSKGNPAKFGEAMSGKGSSGELSTQIKRGPRMANVSLKHSLGLNPGAMMSPKATALATKVLPRLYGWGPSKAGKMQQHAGQAESASGNMRHKNYFINCNFSGFRSPEFQKTLDKYKHATKHLQPFTLSPGDQGKAYWNASPNTKSLCSYNTMPTSIIDATGWKNFYGPGGSNHASPTVFPFSWNAVDEEAITAMDPNRPAWATATTMSGDRDVLYPVVSRHMRYMFQNSNAYLPLKLKIYLLRVKSLVTLPQQPTTAWVGTTGPGTQDPGYMDVDQYIRRVEDPTLFTGNWIKEQAVTLGAFPGLSQVFKEMFYIENVYQQTLEPSDTLQFNMNFESSSPLKLSDVVAMKKNILNKSYSTHCPYTIMVEFQGAQPCTLVPTIDGTAQQDLTRLMETGPARLRMVWEKSATLAFPSYAQTFNSTPERGNLEPISNMPQENRTYSVKQLNTSYDYDSMNDQTTGWEIPVVTNQDIKYSTPISRMV